MKKTVAMLLALLVALGCLSALAEADLIIGHEAVGTAEAALEVAVDGFTLDGGLALDGDALAALDVPEPVAEEAAAENAATKTVAINAKNFPDAAFRQYVLEYIDTNKDKKLSPDEANAVLDINIGTIGEEGTVPVNCKNVKGIEFFPNLETLIILGGREKRLSFTSLDVSKNTNLTLLIVCFTKLSKLDVSKNSNLVELNIGTNKAKALTLGDKPRLEHLVCDNNLLTKLDVSKCPELDYLQCHDNKLTKLDVTKNTKLTNLQCQENSLSALDVSKCPKLDFLDCNNNKLTKLDVSKNTKLGKLYCEYNKLRKLDVTKNTRLELLWCYDNSLKALDLSKNTRLVDLHCGKNKLKALDVSKCKKLETMYCEANAITKIDIAKLPTYLRKLARENEFEVGDGLMYIIPEEGKGICLDASVKVYDGKKVIHKPA